MIREVDLAAYLPEFMHAYKEPVAALDAENPEFDIVWKTTDQILNNRFIATADEYGISRFENMLGIYPSDSDSLEIRRMRVQNRWSNKAPYTIRILAEKLSEVLKGNSFSILADFGAYELIVTIYTMDNNQITEVKYLLSVMVPENICYDIVYESVYSGSIYFGAVMRETDIINLKQRKV